MPLNVSSLSKTEIRLQAKALRQSLPMASISQAICTAIEHLEAFKSSHEVLAFYPLAHEVDLRPLMSNYPNKNWFLPRIMTGNQLAFFRYNPKEDDLFPNPFGVMEPTPNAEVWQTGKTDTLLLVPGLVFDTRGHRLGYGKGYYDRFLSNKPGNLTAIGVVADDLMVEGQLPTEALDIAVEGVITEHRQIAM